MFKEKKKLIFVVGLLLAAAIAGVFLLRPSIRFVDDCQVLERTAIYPAEDFVVKSNGNVTPEAKYLDTEEVGIHSFHYRVKKWIFEKDAVFHYEVVDTTPPVIEIKEKTVFKDPGEVYSVEEINSNISINEGTFLYETDYNSELSDTYSVYIRAEDDYGNVSEAVYEVVVRDLEAPFVFRDGDGALYRVGSEFNILDIVAYGDNADPMPELTIEGKVDTSKEGNYPLHAILTDRSGNKTEWELTVEVRKQIPDYEPEEEDPYLFEDFIIDYAGEGREFGIDVSSWQGDIDFEAVKAAGCDFVIIRIGFSYEGEFTLDNQFRQNLEKAKKAGLKVGVYHFSYDNNEKDLLSALDMVFQELNGETLELPLIFDWEDFWTYQEYEMSFQDLNHLYDVFEKEVNANGYQSMLYGSRYYLDHIWTHTDRRSVWLAQYTDWPSYEGPYQIWQLSDSGRIDGIEEPVDLDILFVQQ
ncbi:MAG: hypothetical protein IJI44_08370 [Erysipelotrichaceae bacterium]|nr:hypothetical protein [Erysipelotrichaceae bacterium]